ncbi:hypothetical protein [Streptomyces sp. NBC_00385]|uniref:hypothetical protein n=1 Tax=Streptomyces sp. NBC_00385 TaxID=2975733 RepID=UPI002DDA985A|nr:hypothetical protein [Streptomyces sp. NBC_00385]WRZ08976.1 hypothetical protein OG959_12850 [Streptomyces sp. NBC_00385]
MTSRGGEAFEVARAASEIDELLARPLPEAGPTAYEWLPVTEEWSLIKGRGLLIAPLWESDSFTGLHGSEWDAASEAGEGNLAGLVVELERRWGPHRRAGMRVPINRKIANEPMPPLFRTLCDNDLLGDLAVWGPVDPSAPGAAAGQRWLGISVSQCDGDASMILTAVVTDQPIPELEG